MDSRRAVLCTSQVLEAIATCLRCAALAGTYCIVTLVNGAALGNTTHPAVAGGMQWYVDQVLGNGTFGSGGSYNRFYTNPSVIQAGWQIKCSK